MKLAPLGPLGAFDSLDFEVIVFDEKKNQLIKVGPISEEIGFLLPAAYQSNLFYWAAVHWISPEVVFCLLKSHVSRVYQFVSFRLDSTDRVCHKLHSFKTNVYSNGYRIQSHRAGSQFVFSINNAAKKAPNESTPPASDREIFERQVRNRQSLLPISRSTPCTPALASPQPVQFNRLSEDSISMNEGHLGSSQSIREGVVLVARCDRFSGDISANIVSLGKQRLGVKLRRIGSIRQLKHTIGTKFMTKWSIESDEVLCEPILCGGRAILLCRNDPSMSLVMNTVANPRHGITAAIQEKVGDGIDGLSVRTTYYDPSRLQISGLPPDPSHIWSNLEVVDGVILLLTVAPSTGYSLLFSLHVLNGTVPRMFWKYQEVALSVASRSLRSVFIRCRREGDFSATCQLAVRGVMQSREATKSYTETTLIRI